MLRPGQNPKDTACVILLHKYESDRSQGDWDVLARDLQKAGFAVLSFDFRGHGGSTSVSPNFWNFIANQKFVRDQDRDKSTISFKDFSPSYFPVLVNDILAARRFLEVKNDGGEVNTSSIFLIGAQEGASLGMLFVATEWVRYYTVGFTALLTPGTKKVAGEDIAGCVWLSPANSPGFNANTWIRNTPMRERTPMFFAYGERDVNSRNVSENIFRLMTGGRDKNKHTQKLDLKGTDLAGQALLGQAALGVNARIIDYLNKIMADRKAIPWSSVSHDVNPIQLISLRPFGFSRLP
jgi:hypothetical protein